MKSRILNSAKSCAIPALPQLHGRVSRFRSYHLLLELGDSIFNTWELTSGKSRLILTLKAGKVEPSTYFDDEIDQIVGLYRI